MNEGVPAVGMDLGGSSQSLLMGSGRVPAGVGEGTTPFRRNLVLVVLLAGFALPNLAWVLLDRRVWPWDQAWYGEVTADLIFLLLHSPEHWYGSMISMMPSKPPLLTWLGQFVVPLGLAAGSVDVALLCFLVMVQTMTLALIWAASRAAAPQNIWASTAALLFAAGAPLFVGLSHQYLVEPFQILDVAASLLLALWAPRLPALRSFGALALLVVVAFASKTTSFIYCGLFWMIAAWFIAREVQRGKWGTRGVVGWAMLAAALLLGVITMQWYLANMGDMLAHVRAATSGPEADLYGHRAALVAKLIFWWQAEVDGFFAKWDGWAALLLALVMSAAVLAGAWKSVRRRLTPADAVAAASVGHVAVTTLLLASQPNEETRFLVPLVPDLAFLVAWSLGPRLLRPWAGLATAVLFAQFATVTAESLGAPVAVSGSAWLLPVKPNRADRIALQDLMVATCPASDAGRINVVGTEYPQMNANSMAFFAAKGRLLRGFRCYYTSLGYAETNVGRALARVRDLHADYIIFPQPASLPANPDAFNQTLVAAEHAVATSPDFTNVGEVGQYDVFKQAGP